MVTTWELIDRTQTMVDATNRSQLTLLAAAIAFFALLSALPLAVVVIAVAATVGGGAIIDPIASAFDHLITEEATDLLRTGLEADGGRSGATLVGVVFTLWASLRVFRGLDRAFNAIYGQPGQTTLTKNAINAVAVLFALLGIIIVVGSAMVALNIVGMVPMTAVPLLTMPLLALVLLPLYALFPPGPIRVKEAIPGALIAAVGITIATGGLQLYIELAGPFAVYGVLAGIFVVMLWLYIIALIVLVGAVANATHLGAHRQLHVDGTS